MVGYLTTDENGEFTGTIQGLSAGTYILTAEFEGDSLYNPSNDSNYFNVVNPNIELSLVTSAQIIETGDSVTITATLTEDELPLVGEEIEYKIITYSGTTSNSDFTNNAGQITISYTGTGLGDIEISVSYNDLEETVVIEDCIKAWMTTYSSGYSVNYSLPSSFQIEFTIKAGANMDESNIAFLRFNDSNGLFVGKGSSRNTNLNLGGSASISNVLPVGSDAKCILTYENGSATLSYGEDSVTVNNLNITLLYKFECSANSTMKNIKVKTLE
jgi:hypothetical protein